MKRVLAAGGIVINRFNEVLLIYRRTMWDLPKGHIEKNETPETCALREVSEETGLKKLQITNYVGVTEHVYYDNKLKKEAIKQTYWFEMKADKNEDLHPQYEESIERVIWVPVAQAKKCMDQSFENLKEIFMKWCSLKK